MTNPRSRAIEDACEHLQILKVQLIATRDLLRDLLPEEVASELHYNGYAGAIARYPEYKRALYLLVGTWPA